MAPSPSKRPADVSIAGPRDLVPSDQLVELGGELVETIRKEMPVDVVGDRDGRVAELTLDELGVGALIDHQRGCGVSQLVDL